MDENLYQYVLSVSLKESDALRRLRKETEADPMAVLQISPEQGQLMAMLVKIIGASRIIEIGTFTGYSTISMAEAMPPNGQLITCDINEAWTSTARNHWQNAGFGDLVELRLAPALETLEAIIDEGHSGQFDMVFIDADKGNYSAYYERAVQLVRSGGMILLDNTLWKGKVADVREQDPDTTAIRAVNSLIFGDDRVDASVNPIGDGLTLVRKR